MPAARGEAWSVELLSEDAASDAVLLDFDGDGQRELGVIAFPTPGIRSGCRTIFI